MAGQGGKTEDSSLGSVYEDCKVQVEKNQDDVNNFINANINHLSENEEIASMITLYSANTTKTLNLFKMNKCKDEFKTQYESVYKEHNMLLVKIPELEVLLLKKHKRAKIGRRVAIGVAGAVFLPVVVLTVLASSLTPAYSAGAASMSGERAFGSSEKLAGMLKKYENSKEAQIVLCLLIENSTHVNIEAMGMIKDRVLSHS